MWVKWKILYSSTCLYSCTYWNSSGKYIYRVLVVCDPHLSSSPSHLIHASPFRSFLSPSQSLLYFTHHHLLAPSLSPPYLTAKLFALIERGHRPSATAARACVGGIATQQTWIRSASCCRKCSTVRLQWVL